MQIKHWKKFQHFKDRKPPWVKLYRDVLDDLEWYELDPLASKVLVMCWLIASEDDGRLPPVKTLAFRLRMTEKQTNDCLNKLSHWLEQDDINAISERYQDDSLETETETEREKEKEKEKETKKETAIAVCPNDVDEQVWSDFLALRKVKKAPMTVTALAGIKREADKANWSLDRAITECVSRGWVGFKAEWVEDKPKLVNKFDVAHVTVPSSSNRDPALVKLDEDRKKAAPPNPEVLAKIRAVLGKTA